MTPTVELNPEARAFWDRHAERLAAAGILTEHDVDAFTLLCQTWSRVQDLAAATANDPSDFRAAIQYTNVVKQFERLASQFGILPRVRRSAKMNLQPEPERDPFGL